MRETTATGAVTFGQKLGDLVQLPIELVSILDEVSWKIADSAAIDSIRHPEGSDRRLFTAVIINNLDFAEAKNVVQIEVVTTNSMAFTRTATVRLFNADNVDNNAFRVGSHGSGEFLVHFERKK
jgi:hypothetical protein